VASSIVCALIGGGIFVFTHQSSNKSRYLAGDFGVIRIPLNTLEAKSAAKLVAGIQINGTLQVTDSLLLGPSAQPSNPQLGQIYLDKTSRKLGYYDGLQFQTLGNSTGVGNLITNVTTVLSGTGNGVQLQASSPGSRQIGHFNISGTGAVGKLVTTVIDSNGGTFYINPVSTTTQQQIIVGTPASVGLNTVGSTVEPPQAGWRDNVSATKVTMGEIGGTSTSIAVYFNGGTPGDHVQVGLYEDDGNVPSRPGAMLAGSASVALTPNGFTTVPIPSTLLNANTSYWIAVNTDSTTVGRAYVGGSKSTCFKFSNYGFMPNPFSTSGCFFDDHVYSMYLNYLMGAGTSGSLSSAAMAVGVNGQVLFQNSADSNTAFQVQNATGTNTIFNIDTLNGRIAIGKASPQYKLDIAGGDINLSTGRSVRFGGVQVLNSNADNSVVSVTNFASGGMVAVQADGGFAVRDADANNTFLNISSSGATTLKNKTDSTAALQVQNAASKNVFTIDTTANQIILGNDGTAANVSVTGIRGGAASGNNITGKNLEITAGNGTGTGGSGDIVFKTASGVSNPQVTFDSTNGNQDGGTNTMTWSHTTGNHPDPILIVAVNSQDNSSPATATSVTYNGVALTLLTNASTSQAIGSVWYLINPPTGSHAVVATYNGSSLGIGGESTTFYNVDQTNPIANFNSQSISFGLSVSTTVTGTNAGMVVFDALLSRQSLGVSTQGNGQTQLYQQLATNVNAGSYRTGVAGSTTMSWSGNNVGAGINHIVVALNPEPNITPDPLTEALRITQSGTVGIALTETESTSASISLGGSADRTIAINQNPTTGAGHSLTVQAGGGAIGNNNGGNLILQGGIATGTGTSGSVIVRPASNTSLAFQVQNADSSSVVLSVDTTSKIVQVINLGVSGHIITSGTTPGIAAGAAACTTPTATISGNDTSGVISVTTGTGCASSGVLATVTFASVFGAAPHVLLTPAGASALALGVYVNSTTTTASSFTIDTASTPTNSTVYKWNYIVLQ
jgi:hypothetical protein